MIAKTPIRTTLKTLSRSRKTNHQTRIRIRIRIRTQTRKKKNDRGGEGQQPEKRKRQQKPRPKPKPRPKRRQSRKSPRALATSTLEAQLQQQEEETTTSGPILTTTLANPTTNQEEQQQTPPPSPLFSNRLPTRASRPTLKTSARLHKCPNPTHKTTYSAPCLAATHLPSQLDRGSSNQMERDDLHHSTTTSKPRTIFCLCTPRPLLLHPWAKWVITRNSTPLSTKECDKCLKQCLTRTKWRTEDPIR
mmetsp:Transcript_6138/g.11333  ORF Transcript_6138/g.11333 Transcript_6138/m.11333 type:complete len:248 (-) Transcript_6138:521-1264(-)